jgi:hypothetical protein
METRHLCWILTSPSFAVYKKQKQLGDSYCFFYYFWDFFLIKTLPTWNPNPRPAVDASELQMQEDDYGNIQEENQGDHCRLFSTVLNILTLNRQCALQCCFFVLVQLKLKIGRQFDIILNYFVFVLGKCQLQCFQTTDDKGQTNQSVVFVVTWYIWSQWSRR